MCANESRAVQTVKQTISAGSTSSRLSLLTLFLFVYPLTLCGEETFSHILSFIKLKNKNRTASEFRFLQNIKLA